MPQSLRGGRLRSDLPVNFFAPRCECTMGAACGMEWGLERKLTLQLRRAEGGMGKKSHGTVGGRLEIIQRSLWEKEKSFTYSKNFNLRGLDMLLIVTVANDYIQRSFQLSTCLTRHFLGLCVHWVAGVITWTFTSFLVTAIIYLLMAKRRV